MKRRAPARGFECPNCGAFVRAGARACRECGSDAETGWSEDVGVGDVELSAGGYASDRDFDYDAFLAREGLDGAGPARRFVRARWRLLAVALLALLFLWWVLTRR